MQNAGQSHLEATSKPLESHPNATPKPPESQGKVNNWQMAEGQVNPKPSVIRDS
jgi:hypothetical protein